MKVLFYSLFHIIIDAVGRRVVSKFLGKKLPEELTAYLLLRSPESIDTASRMWLRTLQIIVRDFFDAQ